MTIRNLEFLLAPRSVALVGASAKPASVGLIVARNLLRGGFGGPVWLVNPEYREIEGQRCYPSMPAAPDLAVVATPPATVPGIVSDLGREGTRAAVVITAGVRDELKRAMLEAARTTCLRIQGPNCLGLMVPGIGLDASFSHVAPGSGDLAFLSQSGALITAVVDWAKARHIGLSHVISLGDMADVDFGDLLFYALRLGLDLGTARSMVVNTIVVLESFYPFNVRYLHMTSFTWRGALGTRPVLIACAVLVGAQFAFTYWPVMQELFLTRPVALVDGILIVAIGIMSMVIFEGEKHLMRRLGVRIMRYQRPGSRPMTAPSWMSGPPKRILLATDLSPRCDRALDRAAALAAQWQSALVALHVLEKFEPDTLEAAQLPSWRRPPDPVSLAWKQLHVDASAVAGKATVLVGEGDPAETILRLAETEQCDLIVIGIARDELLGRFSLGRTVHRLLRRARVPLLVVKDRPRGAYDHIVVATDFSDSSRHALEAAARFFPEQRLTVFHAYDAPMSGLMADPTSYRRDYRKVAAQECEAFLEKVDRPATWQTPHVLIEDGPPTFLLRDYVGEKGVDLVVLGTHGRSAILEVLIGSVAKAIMDEAPCDALVIREPHAAVET